MRWVAGWFGWIAASLSPLARTTRKYMNRKPFGKKRLRLSSELLSGLEKFFVLGA
jgi:hypothetical protein